MSKDTLGVRALSLFMSLILAVGLMPVPALAEALDEADSWSATVTDGAGGVYYTGYPGVGGLDVGESGGTKQAPDLTDAGGDMPQGVYDNEDVSQDMPTFEGSCMVDGVRVAVSAERGAFPAGVELVVEPATKGEERMAETAVGDIRPEGECVASSRTYNVRMTDTATGAELQPADGRKVTVSFSLPEVSDPNLTTSVYHILDCGTAENLGVETQGHTAVVESDGFSLYTVEFTYGEMQYVMVGGTDVPLSEVLLSVGLEYDDADVTDVRVSDGSLFNAFLEDGRWVVSSLSPFSSTEWMRVTVDDVVYEIAVTDDQSAYSISSGSTGITINASNKSSWDHRTITGTKEGDPNRTFFITSGVVDSLAAIVVDGIDVSLTFRDLHIDSNGDVDSNGIVRKFSPVVLKNGANLRLTLAGSNTLMATYGGAGICVPQGCSLTIDGDGSLEANGGIGMNWMAGAGIGMASGGDLGTVTIEGGTIAAYGGSYDDVYSKHTYGAAGIGAAYGNGCYPGGTVIVKGGTVNATGGGLAAGIGGGMETYVDSVMIEGGTVTAKRGAVAPPSASVDT